MEHDEHSGAVVVFAKVPGLGIAKSRIAATEGKAAAHRIYEELLGATARTVRAIPHHVAFTGSKDPGRLREIFPGAVSFFEQRGRGLGERLCHAFEHLYGAGAPAVCAIGCDCPSLPAASIQSALKSLTEGTDTVIGPAHDGGYYLVGARRRALGIFDARGWGTERLFEETRRLIERHGFSSILLEKRSDIDVIDDYRKWKGW